MTSTLTLMERRVWPLLLPPRRLPLSAWAEAHFSLPAGDPNAGPWHSLPYQIGIQDAITDPLTEYVTVMKSARVGYTLGCLCVAVGYYTHHDPSHMLLVQPTIEDAKKFSKENIAPILDLPILRGLVSSAKSRSGDNTLTMKLFRGGSLSLVGANSPRGFRRTSQRIVMFDEIDGYPASAGTEGDPIELAIRRTDYYWNRKIIAGSTPTDEGVSKIEKLFEAGDQRRYYVPCPHCGEFQVLKPEHLKWPEAHPEQAYFVCPINGCVIEHRHKRDIVAAGEWRAEAPEHFTEHNRHASFHLWAAYSYSPNATWGQIALEWVRAARGGAMTHKTFKNTWLGQTWRVSLVAVGWERLYRRREAYTIGTVPRGVLVLTCGVDVQKDRLVYEVVGWGRGKRSWSIDYGVLPGDTSDVARGPWSQLDTLLARTFPHAAGGAVPIRLLAIDGGYNTQQVYAWARQYPPSRVLVVKGQESRSALIVGTPRAIEVNYRGTLRRGFKSWPVYGHTAKDELYGWLGLEAPVDGAEPPPGFCHFPEYDEEYFRQLTSETLQVSRDGRRYEYRVLEGRENHALDCFDAETEVLARDGWKRFEALKGTELLATVNLSTDAIEYQAPAALIARPYSGKMLHLLGRRLDIMVTPEHRMVTYKKRFDREAGRWRFDVPPEITLARDLTLHHMLKCAATWTGRPPTNLPLGVDAGDFAEFLGWFVSEGYATRNVWRGRIRRAKDQPWRSGLTPRVTHVVGICQRPGAKMDRIAALVQRLPWRWRRESDRCVATSKPLYEYVKREIGFGAANKRIPQWIKDAPAELIARFVEAAILGDGWTQQRPDQGVSRTYATVSRQLADDMQELFIKLGRTANIRVVQGKPWRIDGRSGPATRNQYHVSECRSPRQYLVRRGIPGQTKSEFIGRWVDHVGVVYCATVPNGTLICRRRGRAFIAGNCRVYARAAAFVLQIDRWPETVWAQLERDTGQEPPSPPAPLATNGAASSPPPAPPPRRPWLDRPRGGWLRR
jgi:phage terminase large subunit GpA-like protein